MNIKKLDPKYFNNIVQKMGDQPYNMFCNHALLKKTAHVYYSGTEDNIDSCIIDSFNQPGSPVSYGNDSKAIMEQLSKLDTIHGFLVNDNKNLEPFKNAFHSSFGIKVCTYNFNIYILKKRIQRLSTRAIKLEQKDICLLENSLDEFNWHHSIDFYEILDSGYIFGIIEDGKLISVAASSLLTNNHANINVYTSHKYIRNGYANDCANKLIDFIFDNDKIPVWHAIFENAISKQFAKQLNFQKVHESFYLERDIKADMLVKLYNIEEDLSLIRRLKKQNIFIKRALAPDKSKILSYVKNSFEFGYESECDVSFSNNPISCFIAVKDEKIIGFACYDATAKNFFGPLAVSKRYRKNGIGKALTIQCMLAMKNDGYGYAIIGWVDFWQNYYKKIVDAKVIKDSFPGVYSRLVSIG